MSPEQYLNFTRFPLIFQKIGDAWVTDLSQLRKLEPFKGEKNLLVALQKVKQVGRQQSTGI